MMRGSKVVLLFVLAVVSLCYAQECNPGCFPCEKITNATQCVDSNVNQTSSEIIESLRNGVRGAALDDELQYCVTIFFNNICVIVDITNWGSFFDNVTISITVDKITVFSFETTLPNLIQDGGVCLDDNTVIEILLLIPSLRNDVETYLKILELTGCEPRGLFSLCFYFTPCSDVVLPSQPTSTIASTKDTMCGCFSVDFQLLYWRDYCVLEEEAQIGCVNQ